MTDRDVKKLSRKELLEILVSQGRQIEQLKQQLDEANQQLASREISIQEAGSLAEAALRLNHIFQDADRAAQQYLANVKLRQTQKVRPLDETQKEDASRDKIHPIFRSEPNPQKQGDEP